MGREGLTLKALLQRRWNFILLSFLTVNNATYLYRIFVINFERLIHYYDTSIATRATISPVFFFFSFLQSLWRKNNQIHRYKYLFLQMWSYFWSVFSCIRTEYRKIRTRNNSVFGQFSRSVLVKHSAEK